MTFSIYNFKRLCIDYAAEKNAHLVFFNARASLTFAEKISHLRLLNKLEPSLQLDEKIRAFKEKASLFKEASTHSYLESFLKGVLLSAITALSILCGKLPIKCLKTIVIGSFAIPYILYGPLGLFLSGCGLITRHIGTIPKYTLYIPPTVLMGGVAFTLFKSCTHPIYLLDAAKEITKAKKHLEGHLETHKDYLKDSCKKFIADTSKWNELSVRKDRKEIDLASAEKALNFLGTLT